VAPEAKIIHLKVFSDNGGGANYSDIIKDLKSVLP
jgi:hypothetical protein